MDPFHKLSSMNIMPLTHKTTQETSLSRIRMATSGSMGQNIWCQQGIGEDQAVTKGKCRQLVNAN